MITTEAAPEFSIMNKTHDTQSKSLHTVCKQKQDFKGASLLQLLLQQRAGSIHRKQLRNAAEMPAIVRRHVRREQSQFRDTKQQKSATFSITSYSVYQFVGFGSAACWGSTFAQTVEFNYPTHREARQERRLLRHGHWSR